jgi:hypothetical protein
MKINKPIIEGVIIALIAIGTSMNLIKHYKSMNSFKHVVLMFLIWQLVKYSRNAFIESQLHDISGDKKTKKKTSEKQLVEVYMKIIKKGKSILYFLAGVVFYFTIKFLWFAIR